MVARPISSRELLFLTHAAPEDNEFALWLSSKLTMAGYRVWIDSRRLRGGLDFWDEIERVLRNDALKQIIVFTGNVRKDGVKKELAIGDAVRKAIPDPKFMIPVRSTGIAFSEAPPEFLREHIIDANPNWHDCLKELFETLEDADVPKSPSPDTEALLRIVEAREDGRRFIIERKEELLTNWFPIQPPEHIRYFGFDGLQDQTKAWLQNCRLPHVPMGRLAGSFADAPAFAMSSSFDLKTSTEYEVPFADFINGKNLGPYLEKGPANNDVVNLLRQHFDQLAAKRGLLSVEFANKDVGWFFPDGLLPADRIVFNTPQGRRIRRVMSGKFKDLRWHVCIVAKPRVWPELVYRVHVNVVLTTDGTAALPGDKTHARRRRLTKSWWNNVWRDRLLAAMNHLAAGAAEITLEAGNTNFRLATSPIVAHSDVSYDAFDPPLATEEDDDGNIVPVAALDDQVDDMDEGDPSEAPDGEDVE
jgi:TIR domain